MRFSTPVPAPACGPAGLPLSGPRRPEEPNVDVSWRTRSRWRTPPRTLGRAEPGRPDTLLADAVLPDVLYVVLKMPRPLFWQ